MGDFHVETMGFRGTANTPFIIRMWSEPGLTVSDFIASVDQFWDQKLQYIFQKCCRVLLGRSMQRSSGKFFRI